MRLQVDQHPVLEEYLEWFQMQGVIAVHVFPDGSFKEVEGNYTRPMVAWYVTPTLYKLVKEHYPEALL